MKARLILLLLHTYAVFVQSSNDDEEQKPLGCFDTLPTSDCEFMRDEDWCATDIDYLKMKCDYSCGWCSEGEECVDKAKDYLNCEELTDAECTKNTTFYASRCKKSCGWCGKGIWGQWSKWSKCPTECGDHAMQKTRECLLGKCRGRAIRTKECPNKCPTWSDWGEWSACSATCDKGARTRTRTCLHGRMCEGDYQQVDFCSVESCSKDWDPWVQWSPCSDSCGDGYRIRTRSCPTGNTCEGQAQDIGMCKLKDCPTWAEWTNWSSCSVTCGKGSKSRIRDCEHGPGCEGNATATKTCQLPACSGEGLKFDEWTPCSRSCDSGTRIKLLKCTEMDVDVCPKVYEDCNTFPCKYRHCSNFYRYEGRNPRHSYCCENTAGPCGKNDYQLKRRIVGGQISFPKQFPWMARIESKIGRAVSEHFCGGTLIHPEYVATAAHCFDRIRDPERIILIFGSISRADASTYVQRIGVSNITMHPEYQFPVNDIAILKLKKAAVMSDYVRTICLPRGELPPTDDNCFVAGWGYLHSSMRTSAPNLMEAKIRRLPFDFCKQAHRSVRDAMDETHMICAGKTSGGLDTCEGDSGGPFMCQRCSSCSWYLAGITSFGSRNCGAANTTGVYTRVTYFEEWIATIVEPSENATYSCPNPV